MISSNRMLIILLVLAVLYYMQRRGMLQQYLQPFMVQSPSPAMPMESLPPPDLAAASAASVPDDIRQSITQFGIPVCSWNGDRNDDYSNSFASFPNLGKTKEVDENYISFFSAPGTACRAR